MNYKIVETNLFGSVKQYVVVSKEGEVFECFEKNINNPRYQKWIEERGEIEVIE